MAQPIQKAACAALGRFIAGYMPDTVISYEWPAPDAPLPPRAITIICAGAAEDEQVNLDDVDMVPVDDTTGLYTWRFADRDQPIQLDIWSQSQAERDQMLAELEDVLHKGPLFTLGAGNPVRDGILLEFNAQLDGFEGHVDFDLDPPDITDSPNPVRINEWRATIDSEAHMVATVTAQSPRLLRIALSMLLNDALPRDEIDVFDNRIA